MAPLDKTILSAIYRDDDERPTPYDFIPVSSIGDCARKIVYSLTVKMIPRPRLASESHAALNGNALHDLVQSRLVGAGLVNAKMVVRKGWILGWEGDCELTLEDKNLKVRGHCDGITLPVIAKGGEYVVDPSGTRKLIEIKTIGNSKREDPFTGLLREGKFDKLSKPYPNHITQATLYAHLINSNGLYGEPVDSIWFIYTARDYPYNEYVQANKSPVKTFEVAVKPEVVEQILSKIHRIWSYVENEQLPDREYACTPGNLSPFCSFCDYKELCYPNCFAL